MTDDAYKRSMKLAGLKEDDKQGSQIREYMDSMFGLLETLKGEYSAEKGKEHTVMLDELRDDVVCDTDGAALLKYSKESKGSFYTAPLAVKQNE